MLTIWMVGWFYPTMKCPVIGELYLNRCSWFVNGMSMGLLLLAGGSCVLTPRSPKIESSPKRIPVLNCPKKYITDNFALKMVISIAILVYRRVCYVCGRFSQANHPKKILRPWISSMTLADYRVYHQNYTLAIYDTVIYRGYTISQ